MIYFIKSGRYVKIGYSASPSIRLADIQIGNPYPIKVLAIVDGDHEYERKLHQYFKEYHHRGEWFKAVPEIINFVEAIEEGIPQRLGWYRADPSDIRISPADAVRLVVNTAVEMSSREPAIDIMSVTEGRRGPGILIWIPGYVHNGDTIIEAIMIDAEKQEVEV